MDKGKAKTCFVTGGNGKLGQRLIKELLAKGFKVKALVKSNDRVVSLPAGVIPYIGDISDRHVLEDACKNTNYVFHLAAIVSQNKKFTSEIISVNVEGTRNILEAAEKAGADRFVYPSSIDVYGIKRKEMLTEESRPKTEDRYGYSKLLAEKEISKFTASLPSTILRLSTIYGTGFEKSFFKVFDAISKGKMYIIGSGKNNLAIVHENDAANALLLAAEKTPDRTSEIFNITDGAMHTQQSLINMAADLLGVERPMKHLNEFMVKIIAKTRDLDVDELRFLTSNRQVSIDKAKRILGYSPKVSVEKGGKELVEEFLKVSNQ